MKKAFPLRISKDLWDEIQRLAAADLRSANAEIEYLLREAVARRRGARPLHSDDADSKPSEPSDS